MKRFILALAIGCFSLFVFSGIIEYCQLRVGNNYSYKYWYMEEHRDKIRTLLLGNSTIENAINPQLIGDSTFNLASSSRWIYYDFQLLDKYISDMPNLKQVIFGMNYPNPFHHSFHFSDSDKNEYEKHMYEKFMHIKYDDNSNHWLGLFRGYIDYRTLFVGHLCDSLGYEAVEGQSALWQTEHNIDPNVIYNEHAQEELAEFTNYLKDMARLCHIHKVRFIVITPPCHASYIANVRQEGLDILHGIIEDVRSEYPVEYIDYLQDEDYRADSLYYNCSHLNSVGADMFALRVKKDFGL